VEKLLTIGGSIGLAINSEYIKRRGSNGLKRAFGCQSRAMSAVNAREREDVEVCGLKWCGMKRRKAKSRQIQFIPEQKTSLAQRQVTLWFCQFLPLADLFYALVPTWESSICHTPNPVTSTSASTRAVLTDDRKERG